MGLNGAGKTSLLRVLAGVTEADAGDVSRWATASSVGYYAQEHEGITAGRTLLEHMREAAADGSSDGELRALLGMFGLTGDKVVPGRRHALGRREDEAGARPSSSPAATTCCCSTSPPTTSTPAARDAVADALAGWPGTIILVSHDTEFVATCGPTGSC